MGAARHPFGEFLDSLKIGFKSSRLTAVREGGFFFPTSSPSLTIKY